MKLTPEMVEADADFGVRTPARVRQMEQQVPVIDRALADLLGRSTREFNPCHSPAGSSAGGQFCATHGAAPGTYAAFEAHALQNLGGTSRTAKGVSDTSASPDKPKLASEGGALKAKADANFKAALADVWAARTARLTSPAAVEALVTKLASTINRGLLQPGQSLGRTWTTKYPSTAPRDLPQVMHVFYAEFARRLRRGDPVETAAWVEKQHETIHPWADGVGRVTKALAYLALLRGNHALPTYRGRDEYYANIGKSHDGWAQYYRTLF